LDTNASLDEISDRLTSLGLEVEEIIDQAAVLAPFKVAHVISAEQHPDADRLRVCMVDTGEGKPIQVVCGAPNAKAGMKGVFAPSGTVIPGSGIKLKPTKIRGVESNGMLCSEREMMLSDEHDGIIELDAGAPIGTAFADIAGLDDPVIEIAITPNRQDCLGVYGIARDLAASGLGTLKSGDIEAVPATIKDKQQITIDSNDACPVFIGRVIKGIKNGPSPKWLQDQLKAIGLRPISALVDITNFATYDRARPLHVFDADKVKGTINVRMAKAGEELLALDGKTYQLQGSECVVCDDSGVLGLGGVMGGELSGCTEDTTSVLIECALFDPILTAMTGRKLGIESDARYRFERGVDSQFVESGMELATKLVLDICGGEAGEITIAGAVPAWDKIVSLRLSRIKNLGGLDVADNEALEILSSLGFNPAAIKNGISEVGVPSWRTDVVGEADLVEEVLRVKGFDLIPVQTLERTDAVAKPTITTAQKRSKAVKRRLASIGLNECVTWSFISEKNAKAFGGGQSQLILENPISSELNCMRPSILPNLIEAAQRNADRKIEEIRLFEVGPQYADDSIDGQALVATGIRAGNSNIKNWDTPNKAVDVFMAKADAIAALEAAGAPVANLKTFTEAPSWYHPGRSGTLRLGPKTILAAFGELHPATLKTLDANGPIVGFEIYLDAIPLPRDKKTKGKKPLTVSDLQPVERDFAFIVNDDVAAIELINAAKSASKKHIKNITLFDVFAGKGLVEGTKSLALRVKLEPQEKTFTDQEIEVISQNIIQAVAKATGGELR
ncbi:MAG: phenylalanine--tRNA ligase subunit beta, partial [Sphingomonadales bacterium]|nr:phenylalanine--tRNA ligase subunit beta [Sphingomonadales bacterium]